jgi:putative hydrolase of the HAD superfamily
VLRRWDTWERSRSDDDMIDWIAFDADDTLWKNEGMYLQAREVFLEILAGYGITPDDLERAEELEVANIQYYGYGVMSFVLSLIEAALDLVGESLRPVDIRKLLDLGKEMLSAEVELLDGVPEILAELSERYPLMLITKGDLYHQQRKIQGSGLAGFFKALEIVSDKSEEVYREILERRGIAPEKFVMIGNSLRSDVLPVLELGGWAIHLAGHLTWSHENDSPGRECRDRCLEISGISGVPEALEELRRRAE